MAIKEEDLHQTGIKGGNETTRLVLKAANAALASSIPREDVLRRLADIQQNPTCGEEDLLYADAATRLKEKAVSGL